MPIMPTELASSNLVRHRMMAAVVCLALLVRVGIYAAHVPFPPLAKDDSVYDNLAWNMVTGHGFSNSVAPPYEPMAVRTPGYPAFLAVVYELEGRSPDAVRAAQIVLSVVTCVLVYLLALRFLRRSQAVAAAALYAVLPAAAYYPSLLLTEANQALLVTLIVYCAYRCQESPCSARWYVGCVAALTSAIMFRPDYQLLMLPLFGALILVASHRRPVTYRSIAAVLLVVLLITPWVVRNYVTFGRYIGLSSGSGHTALAAKLEAEGLTGAKLDTALQQRYGQAFEKKYGRRMTFLDGALPDQDELRRREVVEFVKSNPLRYAKQSMARVVVLWQPRSWSDAVGVDGDLSEYYTARRWPALAVKVGMLLLDACVIGLAAVGMVLGLFNWRRFAIVGVVIVYSCVIYGLVYSGARYRVPLLPLAAILAVYGASRLAGAVAEGPSTISSASLETDRRHSVAS
jgi:4-amino-4-deoxy-L-arabinose transferase-like glycosyltransferase